MFSKIHAALLDRCMGDLMIVLLKLIACIWHSLNTYLIQQNNFFTVTRLVIDGANQYLNMNLSKILF